MAQNLAPELDIFGDEVAPKFGDSLQVIAVRELIASIREDGRMTPAKSVMCATAIRLAEIISNPKSAIAAVQAASQLTPLIETLTAESGDSSGMTEETKELIRALSIDPQAYARPQAGEHPPQS